VTRREQQRLADITVAIAAIRQHLARGGLSDGLVFDAVRVRLTETGEAVKAGCAASACGQPVASGRLKISSVVMSAAGM